MLTHTTFISLLLTASSLRIQQKEKAGSKCPSSGTACPVTYASSDTNPDSTDANCHKCMCYLEGYRVQDIPNDSGYTLGACGSKVQVVTATKFQNHMYGCAANYMKFGDQAVDSNSLAHGRWHELFGCMTKNLPISTRAVVNPLGVNSYWLDPVVQGLHTQQIQDAYVSKKTDYPGSLPTQDCGAALSRTAASWVTVCESGTNTFDGIGRCCVAAPVSSYTALTNSISDMDSCKSAAISNSACKGKLVFFSANSLCYCGVTMQNCGASGSALVSGGAGATIAKQVLLCA